MKPILALTFSLLLVLRCTQNNTDNTITGGQNNTPPNERYTIKDQTGRVWDITYAVRELGFSPNYFRYGLGIGAIQPINHPKFLRPGDPNYPGPLETFEVIGLSINGVDRAYPIYVLTGHEVANDFVGNQYVAVAY